MRKKNITLITAIAAVILLAAAYFGIQAYRKANPVSQPQISTPRLFDSPMLARFDSDKINRIENFNQGFALVKNGEHWVLVSDTFNPNHIRISQTSIMDRLWIYSSIWSESLIDENPPDISIFGFDNPLGHMLFADSDGNTAEFIIGSMNPARTAYYVMLAGQSEIYTLSEYLTENINLGIDDIRDRDLFRSLELEFVIDFLIEYRPGDNFYEQRRLEITRKFEEDDPYISTYSEFLVTSPYTGTYGADSNTFWRFLESLRFVEIEEFIDDNPSSLAAYGLNNPGRIFVNSASGTFEMLYGRREGDLYYAKFVNSNAVFTVNGLDSILNTAPFSLIDKFILLHHVDHIDRFSVTAEGRTLTGTIQGTGDDVIFHLNSRRASVREFRLFYQTVIGLLKDAELTGTIARTVSQDTASREQVLIEYWHNTPQGLRTYIRLIPYNRDFYLIEKQGLGEFLLARTQVRRIFDIADNMVYLE